MERERSREAGGRVRRTPPLPEVCFEGMATPGLGVPCPYAQADGVPCPDLRVACADCLRARARPGVWSPDRA